MSTNWPETHGETPPVFPAKLRKPDLRAYLPRERLYRRLDAADAPLVVVHADAGYGKTTLIASYLRERQRRVVWYHVGTTDRLPGTLAAHLRHAVAEVFPDVAAGPKPVDLVADPEMSGAALASLLGNTGHPLTLVLEDYARAEEDCEIHRVVFSMVEHLSPGVQVFILSRSRPPLPLARLTMEGRAQTLTKEDLAFTADETAALFSQTYNRPLSDEELALVVRRLEGWAAGLRLTQEALRMTTRQERARFWASFSESRALFDYLVEEVLVSLTTTTLHFLYKTSIFSDLRPDLIEEFLPGSGAAAMLERLARDNLFTTALSGAGTHYRYHNLLRQYLHRQLAETVGEDGVRQLHAQAAELYLRHDEIGYAIGHSLAAGDYQKAVRLMEGLADRHRSDTLLNLMEGWLERAFPGLEGVCGVALRRLLPMSVYEVALPDLRHLAEESAPTIERIPQAHSQQRLGVYYYYRGRLDDCMVWLERSRDTFRAAGHRIPACVSSVLLGFAYLFKGLPELAEDPIVEALELAGNDRSFASMNALFAKAELDLAFGRFQEAEEAARASLDREIQFPVGSSFSYAALAAALLHQSRTEEALEAANHAMSLARQYGVPQEMGFVQMRLATVLRAIGNLKEARELAESAVSVVTGLDFLLARAMLTRAEVANAAGDPDAPRLWDETRAFWHSHGYRMHKGYDGLFAPSLVGQASSLARKDEMPPTPTTREVAAHPLPADGTPASSHSDGPPLVIRCLGHLELRIHDRLSEPSHWSRASARRLFCYLLLSRGRRVPRDEILEALWPDDNPDQSANRLWVAVHTLRRELAPLSHIVDRQGQTYCLRLPEGTDLDLDRYLTLAKDGLARDDEAALREAAALFKGDFLMEYPYEDYAEGERTRLREVQRQVAMALGDICTRHGDRDGALSWYREAQRLAPYWEEPVQRIMTALIARGEPAAAAEAYRRLCADVRREFGLEPTPQIQRLYRQVLAQSRRSQSTRPG